MNTKNRTTVSACLFNMLLFTAFLFFSQVSFGQKVEIGDYGKKEIEEINKEADLELKREKFAKFIANHPYTTRPHMNKKQIKALAKYDRPDLAAEQEFLMTLDPSLGYVPNERALQAYLYAKQKLMSQKAAIPGVSWNERGPDNVGGRTRALMFDPNDGTNKKVWAAGVAGGIWYNNDITNASSTWQNVNDFWVNLAVTTLAYDPTNTLVFYAGTGEAPGGSEVRGEGIWKSSDGGTTWAQLASTIPGPPNSLKDFSYVQKIVVNSSGDVFAATKGEYWNRGGIMKSTDGGITWSKVLAPRYYGVITSTSFADWANDIEIASNGDLYAAFGLAWWQGRIFRSTDNGANWTDISPNTLGQRIEIAVAPSASSATGSTVIYAVASKSGVGSNDIAWFKKSTNGGASWTSLPIPRLISDGTTHFTRGQAFWDLILAVHPANANMVFLAGINQHKSTNGGSTWTTTSHWYGGYSKPEVHSDNHAILFRPGNSNEMIFGNDGGVYYSPDAGTSTMSPSFVHTVKGYNVTQFYACAAKNTALSNYFLAGAQDNGSQQFSTGGMNSTVEVTGGDGAFCHIDQDNSLYQFTSYIYNVIHRSTNGGVSFVRRVVNDQSRGKFINPTDYDNTANILYACGNADQLVRYANATSTISTTYISVTSFNGARISHIRANTNTANRIFIGTDAGRVFKMDNANGSPVITRIDNGSTPITTIGNVSCIDVGATDNELIVTYSNYGVTSVWYTTDGGSNWTSKDESSYGLPDIPIWWALFNPDNTKQVLLATEVGVWSADDITLSNPGWEPSNIQLANVRCKMLQYRTSDKMVTVATFGRGLYTSDVFSNPAPGFSSDLQLAYIGDVIQFTDASNGATSWLWDFGDAATSTAQNPTHAYTTSGKFDVTLTINGGPSITKTSYIHILPNKATPYTLANGGDFETNPDDFASAIISGSVNLWELGVPSNDISNTASPINVWKTVLDADITNANYTCALYTPSFDFSAVGTYNVKFKYRMDVYYGNGPFGVWMEYSTDGGNTWQRLGDKDNNPAGTQNWYNRGTGNPHAVTPNGFAWCHDRTSYTQAIYNASALAGNADVRFRFMAITETTWNSSSYDIDGFSIDDFEIDAVILVCGTDSIPFSEGFESGTFPPDCWATFIGTNGVGTGFNWMPMDTISNTGTKSAFVRYEVAPGGAEDWLVTPKITLAPVSNTLSFFERERYSNIYNSVYSIRVSTTSQTVDTDFTTIKFYPEDSISTTFTERTIDLSSYSGQDVYIAFVMENDNGDNWYIDNISITGSSTIAVTGVAVSGLSGDTAIVDDGGSLQMIATITPSNAANDNVTWSVNNVTGNATINGSGMLTAGGENGDDGNVVVTVTSVDGGLKDSITIYISNQVTPVANITVTGAGGATSIDVDDGTLQMYAAITPANATDTTVTWSLTDPIFEPNVGEATIDSNGLLTAIANGAITVNATANDGSGVVGQLNFTISNQVSTVTPLAWPLQQAAGFSDFSYYYISSHVDMDATSGVLDYNGGARTYDGHLGNDITAYPFPWHKQDTGQVEVIASAAGVITYKVDGNSDQQCTWTGATTNEITIQHFEGSVAKYKNMKNGSLTAKITGDTVAAGEYLGVIGSSGNSTMPHLHFEVYDAYNNLIEPFAGPNNNLNPPSWWISQPPYWDTGINKLMTGTDVPEAVPPICPNIENRYEDTVFTTGQTVYFSRFYRHIRAGMVSDCKIYRPDMTVFSAWTKTEGTDYLSTWGWDSRIIPANAPAGTWKFEVTFESVTYTINFEVVDPMPVAIFASNYSDTICAGSSINFTDQSTGNTTSWNWSFPGGDTVSSTAQNQTVLYDTLGSHNVTLSVTNSTGTDDTTIVNYINVKSCPIPGANFTSNYTVPICEGNSINFTDQSSDPTSWSWLFPGGTPSTSTSQNPKIDYDTAGTYDVTLIAINANGTDTSTILSYITVNSCPVPVANFTSTYSAPVCEGASINFTDQTTNNPVTWSWSFPGGTPTTSTLQNPKVDYNTAGIYSVTLTATNANGSDDTTFTSYITVNSCPVPVASFVSDYSAPVCESSTVNFTDSTSNSPTAWRWSFPGGTPSSSTVQNPSVVYNIAGTYSVTLTATNANGTDDTIMTSYITVTSCPLPVASFKSNYTSAVCEGAFINFTDQSTADPISWSWTLTGGTPATSIAQNPAVVYNTAGTYAVTLSVTNAYGTDDSTITAYITVNTCPVPVADFSSNYSTPICEGDSINFTDLSSSSPTSWSWSFTEGTPATSNAQNPAIIFNTAGTYDVKLVATNGNGSDSTSVTGYITVVACPGPVASFTSNYSLPICEGGAISFTDLSTENPTSWSWTFSGGTPSSSTAQYPIITYDTAGTYDVTLSATNVYSTDDTTITSYISVVSCPAPVADFTSDFNAPICEGDTISFTDLTSSSPTNWSWTFTGGSPSSSTAQNPIVVYNSAGTYDVYLIATNANGSDDITINSYISVNACPPPVANFKSDFISPVCEGSTINFTDQTINNPISWSWSFPGGSPSTSTAQNPSVVFNIAGAYDVTLTATNAYGSDDTTITSSVTIIACPPPVASFISDYSATICEGTSISYSDQSSGNPTSWSWTFPGGDPSSSTIQNPVVIYDTAGTYSVTLSATNAIDTDDTTITSYIDVTTCLFPVADFTSDYNVPVCEGGSINFIDLSSGSPTSWSWSFPGGTPATDTVQSPSVTYNTAGIYDVTLIATNGSGDDTITMANYITVNLLQALPVSEDFETTFPQTGWSILNPDTGFTWEQVTDATGNKAAFVNNYSYNASGAMDMLILPASDLSGMSGAELRFKVSYAQYDSSTIDGLKIFVSTDCGNTFEVSPIYDRSGGALATVGLKGSPWSPSLPADWREEIIDLTPYAGMSGVVLTFEATNGYGNNLYIDNINISEVVAGALPVASFTVNDTNICARGSLNFTDLSSGLPNNWNWTFNGGTPSTSTLQNPTVTYITPGIYDVSLIATNPNGSDTLIMANYISVSNTQALPFTEDFEAAFPDTIWKIINPDTSYTWEQVTDAGGNKTVFVENYSYSGYSAKDDLISTALDFTGLLDAELRFKVSYAQYSGTEFDGLQVYISTDCGKTFDPVPVYSKAGDSLATVTPQTAAWYPSLPGDWREEIIDLTSYIGNTGVVIMFKAINDFGNNLFLDDINITGAGSGITIIVDFEASATNIVMGNSIDFTDMSNFAATTWNWTFDGATPSSSTVQNPTNVTYSAPGCYQVILYAADASNSGTETKICYINVSFSGAPPAPNFTADVTSGCSGLVVQFTDMSSNSPTSWQWSFPGGNPSGSTSQNPVITYDTAGTWDVSLLVTNTGGLGDTTIFGYINITNGQPLPFTEDFEAAFPPVSWSIANPDLSKTWEQSVTGGGNNAAFIENYFYNAPGETDYLFLPPVDLTGFVEVQFRFKVSYAQYTSENDRLTIFKSTDCGNTFDTIPVYDKWGDSLSTTTPKSSAWYPNLPGDWREEIIDLTSDTGSSSVVLLFIATNDYGNNLFIDNINIAGSTGSCDCFNGFQDTCETGIDCGGSCITCPTCSDGIQNQGETDIDCGGPCASCGGGEDAPWPGLSLGTFSCPSDTTVSGNTAGANDDCSFAAGSDHIYQFILSDTADVKISTCGSNFDTRLFLYNSSAGACSGLPLDENDDFCGLQSTISKNLLPGTYIVVVEGYGSSDFGSYSLNINTICGGGGVGVGYCIPNPPAGTSSDDFIDGVVLGTINNTSSGSSTGPKYTDYTDTMSTDLDLSGNYNISITGGNYWSDYYAAWIDYNQDGDFYDAGEKLGEFLTTDTFETQIINFTVPAAGVVLGNTVLRVRCVYDTSGSIYPCFDYFYGETEDYTVNIVSPVTQPANDTICGAVTIVVNAAPIAGTNTNAIISGGEVPGSCWYDVQADNTVWYEFIAPGSGDGFITTYFGTMTDAQLTLYSSSDNTCTGILTEVDCNEDIDTLNYMSEIVFTGITSGNTYFVQLDGWNADTGSYSIEVISVGGPAPVAGFTADVTSGCTGMTVQFTDTSIGADTIYWDFGDGSALDTAKDPTHTFNNGSATLDTTFIVTLIVISEFGDSNTITKNIVVHPKPVINTFTLTSFGCEPYSNNICVTASHSGSATYYWDFDDGAADTTTADACIIHPYTNPTDSIQFFDPSITVVTSDGCSDTATKPFTLFPKVTTNFTTLPDTFGCHPYQVNFVNFSTNAATYAWDFGNGTSTVFEPSQTFTNPSNTYHDSIYVVRLIATATIPLCKDTAYATIVVHPKPNALFSVSADTVCSPFTITISDSSLGFDSLFWTFGDGQDTVTTGSLTHNYNNTTPSQVLYNLQLIAVNSDGCSDTFTQAILVYPNITADFTMTPDSVGCHPFEVNFFNFITGVDSIRWDFGDGSPIVDTSNPSHTFVNYDATGGIDSVYTVELFVSSQYGCGADTVKKTVTVYPKPLALFSVSNDTVDLAVSGTVNFTDATTGATSWDWDFGDGSGTDTIQNSSYTYTAIGTYTVTLIASDGICADTFQSDIEVVDNCAITASFVADNDTVDLAVSGTVNFTDLSTGATSWDWDFGDGSGTDTIQNSSYTYTAIGTYTVTLIASDGICADTFQSNIEVVDNPVLPVNNNICGAISMTVDAVPIAGNNTNTTAGADPAGSCWYGSDLADATLWYSFVAPASGSGAITTYAGTLTDAQLLLFSSSDGTCTGTLTEDACDEDGGAILMSEILFTGLTAGNTYFILFDGYSGDTGSFTIEVTSVSGPVPVAGFTADVTSGCTGITALFTDLSTNTPTSWSWSFTGGTPAASNSQNPSVTYSTAGSYDVKLVVTNANGSDSLTQVSYVTVTTITASFVADNDTIDLAVTGTVNFTDLTTGATSWNWDFGDSSGTSISQNPSYTYTAIGTYTVTFIASDGICADTFQSNIEVVDNTGIKDPAILNKVNIYPNPTSGIVNFHFNLGEKDDITITIHNIAGKLIYSGDWKNVKEDRLSVDIGNEPAGNYYIEVRSKSKILTKRIVKL